MNLVLVGYRGTGKTTLARRLARGLGLEFLDTDAWIVEREGRRIPEIFRDSGEAHFRDVEAAAAAHVAAADRLAVATGGGIILRAENRRALRGCGLVVWLRADADTIHRRINGDANRPALTDLDPRAEIEAVLDARTPLYRETAHLDIDTGALDEQACLDVISEAWKTFSRERAAP